MIPKIIHQTAPKDESIWHPIWQDCHKSWKNCFPEPEYQHIMWTDENIETLIKENYNEYYDTFCKLPLTIMKVDFSRFCMLHSYGGIYADMDLYCHKNFHKALKNDLYLLESFPEFGEIVQNSLMASIPKHNFWIKCMNYTEKFIEKNIEKYKENLQIIKTDPNPKMLSRLNCIFVLNACGPKQLSLMYKKHKEEIDILPKILFNSYENLGFNFTEKNTETYNTALEKFHKLCKSDSKIIIRNYTTGLWGCKETVRYIDGKK